MTIGGIVVRTRSVLVPMFAAALVLSACHKIGNMVNEEKSQELDEAAQQSEQDGWVGIDWDEAEVQQVIHEMSHQKIKASEKWGAIKITQDRIEVLLNYVQEQDFEHKELYVDILGRWREGDFSRAHKDHNAIWELQGGTVGKATGLLSKEEEAAFIEKHFGKDEL